MKDWLKNVKEQLGETQKIWGWTKEKAGKKRSGNQAKRESWYNKKRFDKLSQKRARQAADALQRKDKETWEKEVSTQTPRTVATQTDLTDPWPESPAGPAGQCGLFPDSHGSRGGGSDHCAEGADGPE